MYFLTCISERVQMFEWYHYNKILSIPIYLFLLGVLKEKQIQT